MSKHHTQTTIAGCIIYIETFETTGQMLPALQLARRGVTKFFKCFSATPPVITKNGEIQNLYLKSDSNFYKFKIESPTDKDQETYGCYGTHEDGRAFKAESTLLVGGMSRIGIKAEEGSI